MVSKRFGTGDGATDRRTFIKGATGLTLTAGLAGCLDSLTNEGSNGTHSGPYQVGAAQPLSGGLAAWGSEYNKRGREMALEDINDATIKGNELEFLVEDTATESSTGVSAAQKLVNQDNVPLLMGSVSSGVTMAIAESVTIPNDVVQVINNATSPKIASLDDDRYVLRTSPNDAAQGKAIGRLAYQNGLRDAAIIYINNDFGDAYTGTLGSAFEDQGGNITDQIPYEKGKSSYEPQLKEAMSGDPDSIIFIAYPEAFIPMVKQAYEMGIKEEVQYVGAHPLVSDPVKNQVDSELINGMIGTRPSPPVGSGLFKEFKSSYVDRYDKEPLPWAAYTYDATNLIALAIQKADSFESKPLRDAIYPISRPGGTKVTSFKEGKEELEAGNDINYQGVSGTVNLNKAGDVPATYQKWTYEGGEFNFGETIQVDS